MSHGQSVLSLMPTRHPALQILQDMRKIRNLFYSDDGTVLLSCPKDIIGKVVVHEGTQGIMQQAFKGCKQITSVVFPDSLERIGERAFLGCESLKFIKLPDNVNYVGEYAFKDCIRLQYVVFSTHLKELKKGVFQGCMSLRNVNLSDSGVETIENNCFKDCWSLEKINIPQSITYIGNAFVDCMNLEKVTVESGNTVIYKDAFRGCSRKMAITIFNVPLEIFNREYNKKKTPTSSSAKRINKIRKGQFGGKNAINKGELQLWLPETIEAIEEKGFQGSTTLIEIGIPGTVKYIGMYAFSGCTRLGKVTIKEGVEHMGAFAFEDCKELKSIVLPDSLKSIGRKAFTGCDHLERISISKVTKIADDAFGPAMPCVQIRE